MAATGRYHRRAHNRLMDEGIEVALINPRRARQFAQAAGKIAKTDSVDARTLAKFGQVMEPEFVRPDAPEQVALKDLIMVRNKLVEHRKSLKIMVQECSHPEGTDVLNDTIADLHTRILELEKMIRAQIRTSRELRRRDRILQSIPGIGPITSAVLCASMPELGAIGPRKAAALIGLAPFNADSGTHSGLRHIKGGRFIPRKALYMAATTAVQCNPDMKQTYQRLKAKGKKHKVALVTVMRKLVILADSLLRADRIWSTRRSDV